MSTKQIYQGIIVPLLTPFDAAGELRVDMARPHIERLQQIGVHGFYVGGSSGEGLLQTLDERQEYLRFVAQTATDTLLIAQVGALSFRDAAALSDSAFELGYDLISSTPPFYFQYSEQEILLYYKELAEHSRLPLLLYNVPATTGRSISIETQRELLSLPNVAGSKHTDTNLYVAERLIHGCPDTVIFHGADEMLTAGLSMGAAGGIGSTYNLMPDLYLKIYECSQRGDFSTAYKLQARVNEVIEELLKLSPSVIPGLKHGLKSIGYDMGYARRPFQPLVADATCFESLLHDLSR